MSFGAIDVSQRQEKTICVVEIIISAVLKLSRSSEGNVMISVFGDPKCMVLTIYKITGQEMETSLTT